MKRFLGCFGTAALGIAASAMGSTIYPTNNGFEVNDLGSGGGAYEYLTVPDWTLSGNPGEAANGSGFGVAGADNGNSDGTTSTIGQAALFQGGDGTMAGVSISQSVGGIATGTLSINFKAETRSGYSTDGSLSVYLDGTLVDTVDPPAGSFQSYMTPAILVTAGSHTIGFAGKTNSGDHTVFVDTVSLTNVVPEPASVGLLGFGVSLLARRRRA